MTFSEPILFQEAADYMKRKKNLPNNLPSSELSKLDADTKRRANFAARLDKASVLQTMADNLKLIVSGGTDEYDRIRSIPEAKAQLKKEMYKAGILPAPVGTKAIKDFYSDTRRQLMIETNVLDTLNFGRWKATQNEEALDVNPAWELVRFTEPKGGPDAERDWIQRWKDAMDEIGSDADYGCTDPDEADGRMVALKNHPIWQALGDGAGGYEDTLGNPWPPFAFNSGMNVIDVPRAECVELGVIGEDEQIEPSDEHDLNESLEASTEQFDAALQKELIGGGLRIVQGVLKLAKNRRVSKTAQVRNRLSGLLTLCHGEAQ